MIKHRRRWIAGLIAIPISLVVLITLLHTPIAQNFIFHKLHSYLSSHSDIDLQVSQIRLNLFSGSIELKEIILRAAHAPQLPPLFKAHHASADIGILDALRGSWNIEELHLEKPEIIYFIGAQGENNLPQSPKPSGKAPDILIAHASIPDGSFRYQDLRKAVDIAIPRWRLSLTGNHASRAHQVSFQIQSEAFFQNHALRLPIGALSLTLELQKNALKINSALIAAAGSRLAASGALNDFSKPSLDLHLSSEMNLEHIAALAGIREIRHGSLSGTIQAKGPLNDLSLAVQLQGSSISALAYPEINLTFEAQGRWRRDSGNIAMHNFRFSSSEGSAQGNASLFLSEPSDANSIQATIRDLNLYPLWKLLHPSFDVASRGSGAVALHWQGAWDPQKIRAMARLNLTAPAAMSQRNLLPLAGNIDATLNSNQLRCSLHPLKIFGTELSGNVSLGNFHSLSGDIQGSSPNLGAIIRQISLFAGPSKSALSDSIITSPVSFSMQAKGNLKQPDISVEMETPLLAIGSLKHFGALSHIHYHDAQIDFENEFTLPNYSKILTQGTLDFKQPETILTVDAQADSVPVQAIATMLDYSLPAAGNIQASAHISGALNLLEGQASIQGTNLSLYGEALGQLNTELHLSANTLRTSGLKLVRDPAIPASNRLEGALSYALDTHRYEINVEGKGWQLQRLAAPEAGSIQSALNFQISGVGTIENPSLGIHLNSEGLKIRNIDAGPISISAALNGDSVNLTAQAPRLNLSAEASGQMNPPFPFSGKVTANGSDLSVLGLKMNKDSSLAGILEAVLHASGNLKDPENATVSANIKNLRLQSGSIEVHARKPFSLAYKNHAIEFTSTAELVGGKSLARISGRLPLRDSAPKDSLTLQSSIDLAEAMAFLPLPTAIKPSGALKINYTLTGDKGIYYSDGTIFLDEASLQISQASLPLTSISLKAEIQNGSLVIQAGANWGQGIISLAGELPFGLLPETIPDSVFRKKGPAEFMLDLQDFAPEVTGVFPADFSGKISLHANGSADSMNAKAVNAAIRINTLDFKLGTLPFHQQNISLITIKDGAASISQIIDKNGPVSIIPGMSIIGAETKLDLKGSAGLYPQGSIDLKLDGSLDAGLLTVASANLKASGKLQLALAAAGTITDPHLSGSVDMISGKLSLREPRNTVDDINAKFLLSPEKITIEKFSGFLNGGTLTVSGSADFRQGLYKDISLEATLKDCFLNTLEGLKSSIGGTLKAVSVDSTLLIEGNLDVLESSYRESFGVSGQLMNYLKAQQVVFTDEAPDPFLSRIRLNIGVRTSTPLLVQNNMARLEASTTNLKLMGSGLEPSVIGRITLAEGGEIILNQRSYYINRGTITFSNQNRIDPELDIKAQTKAGSYEITLQLSGTPGKLTTDLSSEPPLSERDIVSLLLTGKTASETYGREMEVMRTQTLSLLAGQAGEELTGEARKALHLSTFRIDPGLISSESDPGARLTIGQDITRKLSFAYSMNLANGGDQIWAAQYDIIRRLTTQATKQQDNSYRFEFRHDIRFGRARSSRRTQQAAPKFEIGAIRFQGGGPFSEKVLQDRFSASSGDDYDFPKVQKGMDRLRSFYVQKKHLEADIRMKRETRGNAIDLNLTVKPGPLVEFVYEGHAVSDSVKKKITQTWTDGVFETERLDEAVRVLRQALTDEGFLKAEVEPAVEAGDSVKKIHFLIQPGRRYMPAPPAFPGAAKISAGQLDSALEAAALKTEIHVNPQKVTDFINRFYHERGYLQAQASLPQLKLDPEAGTGQVVIEIKEGLLFKIGDLKFTGNSAYTYEELWMAVPAASGRKYTPGNLKNSSKAIERLYRRKGYNEAVVTYRVFQNTEKAQADITFQIAENRQSFIHDIVIEGNRNTDLNFVTRQLDFKKGDPLDSEKIDDSRRRLYATGVYSSVDIQSELINPSDTASQKDMRLRIRLRENRPYRLQYGLFYDTERGLGGLLEAQKMNAIGHASNLGMRLRYDTDLKEGRLFYNQPFVRQLHFKLDTGVFYQEETRTSYKAKRIGFSLIQERSLPKEFRLDYGYRYDHVRWNPKDAALDPTIFQADVPVARLIATLSRDTRDNILDATRGEFSSHTLEFGPKWLGSETGFARYSGQYFRYVPLDKYFRLKTRDPEGNPLPKKIIYAGALRLGLTGAFGGKALDSPERFFAGGGTTIRGFQQDMLGPMTLTQDGAMRPRGGEALFLFNNEIRFPIIGPLHGVGFVDLGNVYAKLSDFNFNLRKTAGAGLRLKIKYIPLRFDYGFKLDRRTGESAGEYFLSIGQAF